MQEALSPVLPEKRAGLRPVEAVGVRLPPVAARDAEPLQARRLHERLTRSPKAEARVELPECWRAHVNRRKLLPSDC